jgi:serine/threonine protein phosphatase 1
VLAVFYSEVPMHKHFHLNEGGRDFIVGDIHGCFTRLQAELDVIGFDPAVDRLFSVGDLVDRGPESHAALEWLDKPWFHAVRGNHEQMAVDHMGGMSDNRIYIGNGGAWFLGLHKTEQALYADAFGALPIAITLEVAGGLVGIVHAECPLNHWQDLIDALEGQRGDQYAMCCMWSRDRVTNGRDDDVQGVRAVVVGHTPMQNWTSMGNVIYIDTGAVFGHGYTILDAATLRPVQ